ncbi:hypothetical protein SCLCIDRAFT_113098 [Scleroderma citrinum Foug A]|uniref:UEV domain-containing protein n=1 Tax=Scleroderma citrinum Foug A TaxID=1036808 RepID=A0A0C3AJW1_9AGAM|nr:hypothetical protein SCLCIDRAFT_113098 [Scleroderma citrinum Foug A]
MSAESLTQRWLRQNVSSYPSKDHVFVDIDAALARFTTLHPKSDVYTYDDGRTQLLLCVHGLLPMVFRNTTYNIPIAVWITRDYPRAPPIAYVVPTQDMLVKATKFVDVSGRCNIDYLQTWERKSEGCNLSALLEAMQGHFSREPPLYAKPKPSSPRPVTQSSAPSSVSPPSRPPPFRSPASHSPSPLPRDVDRPPLPPKPVSSPPPTPDRPPPPIPRPPRPDTQPPQYQHSPIHFSPGVNTHGRDLARSAVALSVDSGSSHYRGSVEGPPQLAYAPSTHVRPTFAQPQVAPPLPPQSQDRSAVAPLLQSRPPNLLDEELADSQPPSDSAPPRPPNPELLHLHGQVHDKIRSEFASLSQGLHVDAERLRAQQTDLFAGEPAIRDEMARLEAVRDVCRNVSSRFRSTVEQAERNLSELRRKGDPEVDELVCSTSIVHNQLINLVAEDNAIEDTIYHLHRALNAGRIDLERCLRTTRVLAEEQFMKRALIEKIQVGIPIEANLSYS